MIRIRGVADTRNTTLEIEHFADHTSRVRILKDGSLLSSAILVDSVWLAQALEGEVRKREAVPNGEAA